MAASRGLAAAGSRESGMPRPRAGSLPPAAAARREARVLRRGRQEGELRAARQVWSELSPDQQWSVAEEVVRTRAGELRLAYPDIVSIGHGHASRGHGAARRFGTEVAVCLMVRKKWSATSRLRASARALPKLLLACCSLGGERQLCAVPTDVAAADDYKAVRPHQGGSALVEADAPLGGERGVIGCVVKVPGGGDQYFALGCLHVLALAAEYYPEYPPGATLSLASNAAAMGALSGYLGVLQEAPELSFDAALAAVSNRQVLNQAAIKPRPGSFAMSPGQVPDGYDIWTGNGPISVLKQVVWGPEHPLPYELGGGIVQVVHTAVIESETPQGAPTTHGDSGSPVVSSDGQMLLGMHIAGDGTAAFMIPAYELLRCDNYIGGLPSGQLLSLDNTY